MADGSSWTESDSVAVWNGIKTIQAVVDLCKENLRRNREIFEGFNPVTGRGCPGERVLVKIPDFPIKRQWMPRRIAEQNRELKKIIKCGSIEKYIKEELQWEYNEEHVMDVIYMICCIRAEEDPAFAFITFYKIQDKMSGQMRPFLLNYPQRLVLEDLEEMRRNRQPIREIILKARQWGGSTLSEGYEKWMQDFRHPTGWSIVIMAHVQAATKRIKAMFTKMLANQPGWSLGVKGQKLKLGSYEGSKSDFIVQTERGEEVGSRVINIGSYENYDSLRSADMKCLHGSEVAYWKKTEGKEPEEVLSSVDIPDIPDTVMILESSGRGAAGFFHDMYQEAKDPDIPSAWHARFIAFFQIENDRKELDSRWGNIWSDKVPWKKVEQEKGYAKLCIEFALWLWENRKSKQCPEGFRETGEFFWQLWEKGASFEAINWYRYKRNNYRTHTYIATEAPSDDIEAFRMSGKLIFDMYRIEALQRHKKQGEKQPIFIGNIVSKTEKGEDAIYTARLVETVGDGQVLRIWEMPNCLKVSDRYVVSVDIGGRSATSDFTVMTVIDRLGMMRGMGGKPKVVARWRGHIRHDLLAWKAAALAHFYSDAELVIESNTADTKKNQIDTEGEHSLSIIDEIADYYDNLYIRESKVDEVTQKVTNVYGFQTNVLTKQLVIDNYIAYIDDQLYYEPDKQAYDELRIYERHDDGTMGNVEGQNNHDDVVMSTGIGLYVSQKMPLPAWIKKGKSTGGSYETGTEADI